MPCFASGGFSPFPDAFCDTYDMTSPDWHRCKSPRAPGPSLASVRTRSRWPSKRRKARERPQHSRRAPNPQSEPFLGDYALNTATVSVAEASIACDGATTSGRYFERRQVALRNLLSTIKRRSLFQNSYCIRRAAVPRRGASVATHQVPRSPRRAGGDEPRQWRDTRSKPRSGRRRSLQAGREPENPCRRNWPSAASIKQVIKRSVVAST